MIRHVLLILLAVSAVLIASAWDYGYVRNLDWTYTGSAYTYHLSSAHGTVSLTIFSRVAEDDFYKRFSLSYALLETVNIAAGLWVAWLAKKARRRKTTVGFPVEKAQA